MKNLLDDIMSYMVVRKLCLQPGVDVLDVPDELVSVLQLSHSTKDLTSSTVLTARLYEDSTSPLKLRMNFVTIKSMEEEEAAGIVLL